MRTLFWLTGLFLIFQSHSQVLASSSDRFALLIGNSRYESTSPLRNPENDVVIVGQALKKSGYQISSHTNLTKKAMLKAIADFKRKASRVKNPIILIYFAGHGVSLDNDNWLLPVDLEPDSHKKVKATSIGLKQLQKTIDEINPALSVLILDACRNDPLGEQTRSLRQGLQEVTRSADGKSGAGAANRKIGTVWAFSTNPGNVAYDGNSGTSPYASALAESILIPNLKIEDTFKRIRRLVSERTKGKQKPWENASLFSDFYFQPRSTAPAANKGEIEYWELASLVDSIESMRRYMKKYPAGLFANLAKQRIDNMNRHFSYKRKAETFPIVKLRDVNFNLCSFYRNNRFLNPYLFRSKFRDRVIFLDVNLSYDNRSCPSMLHGWKPSPTSTDFQIITSTSGYTHAEARREFSHKIGELKLYKNIVPWEFAIFNRSIGMMLPPGKKTYSRYGDCEGSCLIYRGLVRVNIDGGEEDLKVSFAAVDPAEIGLTWKFENTRQVAEALKSNEFFISGKKTTLKPGGAIAARQGYQYAKNTEITGRTTRTYKKVSRAVCAQKCSKNNQCQGFVFDKWNRWCFLKSTLKQRLLNPKAVSAARDLNAIPQSNGVRQVKYYHGKKFPDKGLLRGANSVKQCAALCQRARFCVAFTYNKKKPRKKRCKLMASVGEYFSGRNTDSGIIRQLAGSRVAAVRQPPRQARPVPRHIVSPAFGWSSNFNSRTRAVRHARQKCKGRCRDAIWFRNSCAAIAIGQNGAWAASSHASLRIAVKRALKKCRGFGTRCSVRQKICSKRYGAVAVAKPD